MTYELTYYLFLVFIGLCLCIKQISSERLYSIFTIIVLMGYSLVTRYAGFDVDMRVYQDSLSLSSFSTYYIKEPVYWISSRYVYDLIGSAELTFFIYDTLVFILILKARKNFNLPQYFPYLYLIFFPSVFGINNVFRQFISYAFFIYFISLYFVESKTYKKLLFFILSFLTHNVAAIFSPIVFLLRNTVKLDLKAIVGMLGALLLLPIAIGTKSSVDTGEVNPVAYIIVILFLILFYLSSYRFKINYTNSKYFYMMIYLLTLTSWSSVLMASAQSKRIAMFSLILSLIPIVKVVENLYKQKVVMRIIVFIILTIPTFLFSSSLKFLMTE